MKRILFFGIVFFFLKFSFGNDTARVIQLNTQALQLVLSDPTEAINILNKALHLSQRADYSKGNLITLRNLGNVFFHEKLYTESADYYRRALHYAEISYSVHEIASISLGLGKSYSYLGDRQNALYYLDKSAKFFSMSGNTDGLYETYQTISMVYQSYSKYYEALHYGLEALKISRNLDNREKQVLSLGNLAQIYALLNQQQKAVEHYLQAIQIAEANGNSSYLPILYINTGIQYRNINQYQKSINFFLKAYDLFSLQKNHDGMISSLTEIGLSYKLLRQNTKALNYFLRAKTIAEKQHNYRLIITLNKQISEIYILNKNFHKAMIYLDMNFNIAKELNDVRLEAEALFDIGNFTLQKGNYLRAIDILLQSYSIAEQANDQLLLSEITEQLSSAYHKSGNYEKAYNFLKLSKRFSEKHLKSEEHKTFEMLQSVFEVTNSEQELEILRKTNELERLEKQKARSLQKRLTFGIASMIVLLLLLVYVLSVIRKKNKTLKIKGLEIEASNLALLHMNISLEKQKAELNKLNASLSESNEKLKESEEKYRTLSAAKDKLYSIISHDLRSPFSSIVSFVRIIRRDIGTMSKNELSNLTGELEETTYRINALLENMLQWSLAQSGKISFSPQTIVLDEVVSEVTDLFSSYAKEREITIETNIPAQLSVVADHSMMSAVFRNLISNAVKFSTSGSAVQILAHDNEYDISVSVIDHGHGISQEQLDKILKGEIPDKPAHVKQRGSGLGLLICDDFLKRHHSKLEVHFSKGSGTEFNFKLSKTPNF
jgi:signal transduction histidine kinase